jgi:hypothetical protein
MKGSGVTLCGNTTKGKDGVWPLNDSNPTPCGLGAAVALVGTYSAGASTTDGAVFTMEGGTIAFNLGRNGTVVMTNDYRLLLVERPDPNSDSTSNSTSCTFYMKGGAIRDNAVMLQGSGVYMYAGAELEMSGNAEISSNQAVWKEGRGSIYSEGSLDIAEGKNKITMSDSAKVSGNSAPSEAGIFVYRNSTLIMKGNAEVSGNTASATGSNSTSKQGSGVTVDIGTLVMSDNAKISGNLKLNATPRTINDKPFPGAGLMIYKGSHVYVSGNAIIYGNNGNQAGHNLGSGTPHSSETLPGDNCNVSADFDEPGATHYYMVTDTDPSYINGVLAESVLTLFSKYDPAQGDPYGTDDDITAATGAGETDYTTTPPPL